MTVTESPEQADLGTRLAAAQAAVAPLRERVSQLERDLNAAVEGSDYETASKLQAELGPARQEFALAEASARIIAEMQSEIENARHAEQRKIAEQRRREEAQRQIEAMQTAEAEHLDEMRRHIAIARAGVEAVRESIQTARNHQNAAGGVRREIADLQADLEGVERSYWVSSPAEVDALIEGGDRVLRVVYYGRA